MSYILIDIFLILAFSLLAGTLAKRMGLPMAVAYVLLGVVLGGTGWYWVVLGGTGWYWVVLGGSVLGWVVASPVLERIGEFGVVVLGATGLQLGLECLKQTGWAGVWVALSGIVFEFRRMPQLEFYERKHTVRNVAITRDISKWWV